MYLSLPSRLALVAAACAIASAVLWGWSNGLPEPNWESSSAPLSGMSEATPSPGVKISDGTTAVRPKPKPRRSPGVSKPADSVKPDAASTPVAASPAPTSSVVSQPEPEPEPTVPPVTPTPEPSPVVAASSTPEALSVVATPTPVPEMPRPSDAELAGPLPQHSPGEAAALGPAPAHIEIADIARQPQLWPREVVLVVSQRFPVILNGVNAGNVQVPAGCAVMLRKVNADGMLEIEFQGSPAKVKARATDLVSRVTARMAQP